jgi:hypothetical protein
LAATGPAALISRPRRRAVAAALSSTISTAPATEKEIEEIVARAVVRPRRHGGLVSVDAHHWPVSRLYHRLNHQIG